ncbi:unnamed protein product [Linum trigynum]|uniref:Uncharacterized protein n=1 Tax=Linum trigynum TaxID=586398 RepID=A0AAV2GNA3_9ROSI
MPPSVTQASFPTNLPRRRQTSLRCFSSSSQDGTPKARGNRHLSILESVLAIVSVSPTIDNFTSALSPTLR